MSRRKGEVKAEPKPLGVADLEREVRQLLILRQQEREEAIFAANRFRTTGMEVWLEEFERSARHAAKYTLAIIRGRRALADKIVQARAAASARARAVPPECRAKRGRPRGARKKVNADDIPAAPGLQHST